jgi:formylmethanofuran dehydrogenase subunit A
MPIETNGHVDNPIDAAKIRKFIAFMETVADKIESGEIIHTAGNIGAHYAREALSVDIDGDVEYEKTLLTIDCDAVFRER